MSAAFLHAALPEPFRVLGRWLKPFSLGHAILLERFESAYAIDSQRAPVFDDLIFSVWTCSHSFEEAEAKLRDRRTIKEIVRWGKACRGKIDLLETFRTFQHYISEHTRQPKFWIEKQGSPCNQQRHWTQGILELLTGEYKMTLSEAWNLPLPMAMQMHLSRLEAHGVIRLMSDAEIEAGEDTERNRRLMEKALAAHKGATA